MALRFAPWRGQPDTNFRCRASMRPDPTHRFRFGRSVRADSSGSWDYASRACPSTGEMFKHCQEIVRGR
eukprot:9489832-Pyramimonas_sp.AAC.1